MPEQILLYRFGEATPHYESTVTVKSMVPGFLTGSVRVRRTGTHEVPFLVTSQFERVESVTPARFASRLVLTSIIVVHAMEGAFYAGFMDGLRAVGDEIEEAVAS